VQHTTKIVCFFTKKQSFLTFLVRPPTVLCTHFSETRCFYFAEISWRVSLLLGHQNLSEGNLHFLFLCFWKRVLVFAKQNRPQVVAFVGMVWFVFTICEKKRKNNPAGSVFTRIRRNPKNAVLAPANSRLSVKSRAKDLSNLGNISGRFRHFCHFLTKIQCFRLQSVGFDGLFANRF
jgi:hypothetical protein